MILIAELFTKKNSGEIARKRLKHLLTADRAGCSPELLDLIRADFLRSVSRYLEIDPGGCDTPDSEDILRTAGGGIPGGLCVGAGSYFKEPFTA